MSTSTVANGHSTHGALYPSQLGLRGSFQRTASIGNEEQIASAAARARAILARGAIGVEIPTPSSLPRRHFRPTQSAPSLSMGAPLGPSNPTRPETYDLLPPTDRPSEPQPFWAREPSRPNLGLSSPEETANTAVESLAEGDGFDLDEILDGDFGVPSVDYSTPSVFFGDAPETTSTHGKEQTEGGEQDEDEGHETDLDEEESGDAAGPLAGPARRLAPRRDFGRAQSLPVFSSSVFSSTDF